MPHTLPLLPLRAAVVLPGVPRALCVGRARSVQALQTALTRDRRVFCVAQHQPDADSPDATELHDLGSIATLVDATPDSDGALMARLEGVVRGRLLDVTDSDACAWAHVDEVPDEPASPRAELAGVARATCALLDEYRGRDLGVAPDTDSLQDVCAAALETLERRQISFRLLQALLALGDPWQRLLALHKLLDDERQILAMEDNIRAYARGGTP